VSHDERLVPMLPEPASGATAGVAARLRGAIFGIDAEKVLTRFGKRGWHVDDDRTRDQLFSVWRSVAFGYNAAFREPQLARLTTRIEEVDPAFRGWAWEGAGMGLTLLDRLVPIRRRAMAAMRGPAALIFDHGLGRSFWWTCGADPDRITAAIAAFPKARQRQLWTGLALGATYAGGVSADELESLRDAAAEHRPHMAASAAMAAQGRELAGNQTTQTELGCAVFCGVSASEAARKADQALAQLTVRAGECNYLVWRERISESFPA
jgi:Protein of unknown function (DUF1702)